MKNSDIELLDETMTMPLKKNNKKKKKLRKWTYFLIIIPLIIGGLVAYKIISDKKEEERLLKEKETIEKIKSHYNQYVKTNVKTNLLIKNSDKYEESGSVYSDVSLELDDIEIKLDTKYFKIKNSDYYIEFSTVDKSDELKKDNRYKEYIPFNENIITKDEFTMYLDDKEIYTFKKSMEFPIIIKNYEGKYYVEYDDMLVSIKKEDVEKTEKHENTTKKNQARITTLAYHKVYDTDEKCTDPYICIKKASFDQEMKYLKDNNYMTLTMDELYMYLKGNLQVEKAVVLTFDDGYLTKSMIEVMEKYDLLGTLFIITSSFNDYSKFKSDNIFIQSHTDNLHRNYVCSGGSQGGAILCASEKAIKEDLEKSIEKLGTNPVALAFPFYDYNDKAIKVLKEVGFKMSFIGRAGQMGRATPNKTDVYKIPRMTVWEQSIMSFNKWKSYL